MIGRQVDALVSIGGNDISFSGVLEDLVKGDNVFTASDENDPAVVKARIDAQLVQLATNYDRLKAEVDRLLAPREVYQRVSYGPVRQGHARWGNPVPGMRPVTGLDLDIDGPDYDLIKKGSELNYLIRRKARQFGWRFIDVVPNFVGHGRR